MILLIRVFCDLGVFLHWVYITYEDAQVSRVDEGDSTFFAGVADWKQWWQCLVFRSFDMFGRESQNAAEKVA